MKVNFPKISSNSLKSFFSARTMVYLPAFGGISELQTGQHISNTQSLQIYK